MHPQWRCINTYITSPHTPTIGVKTTRIIKIQNPHHFSLFFFLLLKLHEEFCYSSTFLVFVLEVGALRGSSINHTKHVHPLQEHLNNLFCVRWITESRKNNRETQIAPDTSAKNRLWYLYIERLVSFLTAGCYCRMR